MHYTDTDGDGGDRPRRAVTAAEAHALVDRLDRGGWHPDTASGCRLRDELLLMVLARLLQASPLTPSELLHRGAYFGALAYSFVLDALRGAVSTPDVGPEARLFVAGLWRPLADVPDDDLCDLSPPEGRKPEAFPDGNTDIWAKGGAGG